MSHRLAQAASTPARDSGVAASASSLACPALRGAQAAPA